MSHLDADGFSIPGAPNGAGSLKTPPPMVEVPKFFDGCASLEEAGMRMIGELGQPMSVELQGHDVMYRRLADALILTLCLQLGLSP
jgi:hypothetical protein